MAKETINVGKLMRENAYVLKHGEKHKFRVSPSAVQEMISFIEAGMDMNMASILEITQENNRNTVYDSDVMRQFNRMNSSIDGDRGDE